MGFWLHVCWQADQTTHKIIHSSSTGTRRGNHWDLFKTVSAIIYPKESILIENNQGPKIDPWGTPLESKAQNQMRYSVLRKQSFRGAGRPIFELWTETCQLFPPSYTLAGSNSIKHSHETGIYLLMGLLGKKKYSFSNPTAILYLL